jgi:hypothetical protein
VKSLRRMYLVRKSFFEALRGGLLDLVGDVRFPGGVGNTLPVLVFVGGLHCDAARWVQVLRMVVNVKVRSLSAIMVA